MGQSWIFNRITEEAIVANFSWRTDGTRKN